MSIALSASESDADHSPASGPRDAPDPALPKKGGVGWGGTHRHCPLSWTHASRPPLRACRAHAAVSTAGPPGAAPAPPPPWAALPQVPEGCSTGGELGRSGARPRSVVRPPCRWEAGGQQGGWRPGHKRDWCPWPCCWAAPGRSYPLGRSCGTVWGQRLEEDCPRNREGPARSSRFPPTEQGRSSPAVFLFRGQKSQKINGSKCLKYMPQERRKKKAKRVGALLYHEKTWRAGRSARELSCSFPLSHHVWGTNTRIGGDNVGLNKSTKAPKV